MTRQYIRQVKLVIGQAGGEAIDLSQLHIKFTVRNATVETLKQADIRIYNVADETAKKIQNEYTRVELHAGYGDNVGLIFQGQVAMVKRGKENATDSYVDVFGQDGDRAYNNAYLNTSLAKGWTPDDYYNAMMTAAKAYDIQPGFRPTFIGNPATRGAACYGMLRDHMRAFAETQGCEWNIEDGKLNLVPKTSYIPAQVPVINAGTGMVGTPVQTIQGIEVQCLLNPMVKAGGQIQIDNASLATQVQRPNYQPGGSAPLPPAGTDADGFYKALCVTHTGDTRGQPFYTYIIGVAVDGTAPLTGPTLTAVPDGR